MTTNPPEAPRTDGDFSDQGPRVTREEARDLGRLRRSVTDRHVAGVAGGLARHFDIDPIILRVAFVVLGLMGPGIFLYGAIWLLVPEEGEDRAPIKTDESLRTVLLVIVGVLTLLGLAGNSWDPFWFPWQLIIVGAAAWWLLRRRDGRTTYQGPTYPTTPQTYAASGWVGQTPPPAAPPTGWVGATAPGATPPGAPTWAEPSRPRDPRKRGPRLFGSTLALIAVALGSLGMADLAGVDVADSAYPALGLGIVAVMLLVGAFWGRAGGLILLGLIGLVATAGATAAEHWDGDRKEYTPLTSAEVRSAYDFEVGELILDLTEIPNPNRLGGMTIELDGGVGRIEVIVPRELNVAVEAEVGGPGDISVFGNHEDGISIKLTGANNAAGDTPPLYIDAVIGVGEIEVKSQ